MGFPGDSGGKESAYKAGDPGLIPELGRSLEEGMATHSSILAWESPWTEESGGLQPIRQQRVRHDWVTNTFTFKRKRGNQTLVFSKSSWYDWQQTYSTLCERHCCKPHSTSQPSSSPSAAPVLWSYLPSHILKGSESEPHSQDWSWGPGVTCGQIRVAYVGLLVSLGSPLKRMSRSFPTLLQPLMWMDLSSLSGILFI